MELYERDPARLNHVKHDTTVLPQGGVRVKKKGKQLSRYLKADINWEKYAG